MTNKNRKTDSSAYKDNKTSTYVGIGIIGLGIGWMAGLSLSPVISIIITSVTGAAAAIISALSGIKQKSEESKQTESPNSTWSINPWPLAVLIAALVGGSAVGVLARNSGILGSEWTSEIKKWTTQGLNDEEKEIVRRIFEVQYPYIPNIQVIGDKEDSELQKEIEALQKEIDKWTALGIPTPEAALKLLDVMYPNYTATLGRSSDNIYQRNLSGYYEATVPADNSSGDTLSADCSLLSAYLGDKPLSETSMPFFQADIKTTRFGVLLEILEGEQLRLKVKELCQ